MIEEAASIILKDETRFSTSIRTTNVDNQSFKANRKLVIWLLNLFISNIEKTFVGHDFHVDFSKGIINANISGLFTESGILGVLEASDLNRIDEVAPGLGATIDRYCRETTQEPVTTVFTIYFNLLNYIYCLRSTPWWTDEYLRKLDHIILEFKTISKILFERYQNSGMKTSKWNLLDQLSTEFRRTGVLDYISGGLYEVNYKWVKADYEKN